MNPINNQSKPLVMKKMFLLIAEVSLVISLFIYGGLKAYGQDIIVKKSGDEIKSKVEQVLDTEIKYRKAENPAGPVYSILKSDVFMIKYENGTKDVFGDEPVVTKPEKRQDTKLSFTDKDLQPAKNAVILGGALVVPILGLGITAGAIQNNSGLTIPLGAAATLIGAIGIPVVAHMASKTRDATGVKGNPGLRLAGWIGYGLALGDAVTLLSIAIGGGDTSGGPTYSVAVLGSIASILMAVEANQTYKQGMSLKKTTMILPTLGTVKDFNGHQYPTAGIRINF
jgi:hypothetical protein